MLDRRLGEHIEKKVGLTLKEIRATSPEKLRRYIEKKNAKPLDFKSEKPCIGRGNVLGENLITRKELNKKIDKLLGIK